jgi:hypothetical protein
MNKYENKTKTELIELLQKRDGQILEFVKCLKEIGEKVNYQKFLDTMNDIKEDEEE